MFPGLSNPSYVNNPTPCSFLTCELLWLEHIRILERQSTAREISAAILKAILSNKWHRANSDSIPSPDFFSAEERKIGEIVFSEMK